jgi:hypothetical protein
MPLLPLIMVDTTLAVGVNGPAESIIEDPNADVVVLIA